MILQNMALKKRVPSKIQMNQYDCGPTCLQMILSYYGYDINFTSIKERFSSIGNSRDGISLFKIKQVAESYKLKCFAKKAESSTLNNSFLPSIIFWENKHYVILESIGRNGYTINDPMSGRVNVTKKEFEEKYSKVFMVAYPKDDFEQHTEKSFTKLNYFKNIVMDNKKYFIYSILIALVLQLISLGVPILTQVAIDNMLDIKKYSIYGIIIGTLIAITVFEVMLNYLKSFFIVKLQKSLDSGLTNQFLTHLLRLPYKYFETRSKGDLIMRINSNVRIREILSQNFISTIINIFLITITFGYICYKSYAVAFGLLLIGIMQISVFFLSKNKVDGLTRSQVRAQTSVSSFMTEVLGGICTVKSLGIEDFINQKWNNLFETQLDKTQDKDYFQAKIDTINKALLKFSTVFILIIGIYEISRNQMSIGTLFAFQALSVSFLSPLNSLVSMVNDFVMVDTLLDRIYDVMDSEVEKTGTVVDVNLKGNIKIEDVSFKYSDYGDYSLKNINMEIKAGQKVAIVGKSGSGKSTLAKLIVGLYNPIKGNIFFDNYKSNELNRKYLRQNISVVLQENFLFNKTIYENIIANCDDMDMEDVLWAAEAADISKDIERMPMNYNTIISESGGNLSGGQKQRIALARAIVNRPVILLLDEATSALDTVTESTIQRNLDEINCTQVIIAHRLSTIINSDVIFVVENGQILDHGTHKELIARCSYYKKLYNSKSTYLA
ncbi:peptidase domain-containing ABC transporter [Clostridium estertheticum]|uniref:Peptidase domain-containing ABC transporter n=1 Tax=Clostridium estertheticum TaxID=238834 RepID=A0A5N7IUH8_9CLOT|nr:peptidase domain-containing ABC transporter [Clostridium estertheticum]MPQ33967.1 peptidase domain-containing ABC transporter [Clostridium estertheticum]MPQ64596.1 peptidase domain-containing ABC transporter [Clostridium estertheticum]